MAAHYKDAQTISTPALIFPLSANFRYLLEGEKGRREKTVVHFIPFKSSKKQDLGPCFLSMLE